MYHKTSLPVALAEHRSPVRVLYVASYPPRKCGIATFTKDLTTAINNINPEASAEIIAMNDDGQDYDYPWEVKLRVGQSKQADYELAAHYINQSSADVISLQHEFGLYNANTTENTETATSYLLGMLEQVNKPLVTTFHTILSAPGAHQSHTMRRLIALSSAVVTMTEQARGLLISLYGCPPAKAVMIYHGVPDFTFNDIQRHKQQLGVKANPMILSSGLIGSSKGLEYTINAMPAIVKALPKASFYIVGQTHPAILRTEGEVYRESLQALVEKLGLTDHIVFVNEYLSDKKLQRYYQAADVVITAYPSLDQSGSGMLAWALGAGKVCISTPYNYAREVLREETGLFVEPRNSAQIAEQIIQTCTNSEQMLQLRKRAYARGRQFTWPNVGVSYLNLFRLVAREHAIAQLSASAVPIPSKHVAFAQI